MSNAAFLPFALPDISEAEIDAVVGALRSGWLSSGPRVKEFEAAFAERIGSGVEAVAVNSATAGLHLALEACGVGPGDEVIVPTWTFTATAEVVRYLGATPVFVDVDRATLNLDLEAAQAAISPRTVAVMPVHFAGQPMCAENLANFALKNQLRVVEDAAHAFPASSRGVTVGASDSDAVVYSFYATKTMTTGEGGMVVTRDAAFAHRIRVMRLHGISRDAFDRYRSLAPAWQYEVVAAGYKYNLTDPAAAMGLVQLARAEEMRARREQIADAYNEALASSGLQLPAKARDGDIHAWHLYVVRTPTERRDDFIRRMSEAGVGTSVHFIPLHLQPYWRGLGTHRAADFPVASSEFRRVVSLPIFSSMTDAQVEQVVQAATKASL